MNTEENEFVEVSAEHMAACLSRGEFTVNQNDRDERQRYWSQPHHSYWAVVNETWDAEYQNWDIHQHGLFPNKVLADRYAENLNRELDGLSPVYYPPLTQDELRIANIWDTLDIPEFAVNITPHRTSNNCWFDNLPKENWEYVSCVPQTLGERLGRTTVEADWKGDHKKITVLLFRKALVVIDSGWGDEKDSTYRVWKHPA